MAKWRNCENGKQKKNEKKLFYCKHHQGKKSKKKPAIHKNRKNLSVKLNE